MSLRKREEVQEVLWPFFGIISTRKRGGETSCCGLPAGVEV